jgi:hypothetical protein
LGGELVSKGAGFRCEAKASDGVAETAFVGSDPITPINTPPTIGGARLEPAAPTVTDDLNCVESDVEDADGDKVSLSYRWVADGRPLEQTGQSLEAGLLKRGQRVQCVVTPNDGVEAGPARPAALVTIRNSQPIVGAVSVEPAVPRTTDSPGCMVSGAEDADDDKVSYRYSWRVNGALTAVKGPKLASSLIKRGDSVQCSVKGFDGVALGAEKASRAVEVQNSPPAPGQVRVSPQEARVGTQLQCSASGFTDADKDKLELKYSWTADGEKVGADGPTLAQGFAKEDSVVCTVWATDGTDKSARVSSAALEILNSLPRVTSVVIEPAPLYTRDDARAIVASEDADADPVSYHFSWTVDGREAGGDSHKLDPGAFRRDQRIAVSVTPSDGSAEGQPMKSSPATVMTTAPTKPGILLSDAAGGLSDLQCVVDEVSVDMDADPVSYLFEWFLFDEPYTGSTVLTEYPGDTVPKSEVSPGQRWLCRATPSDGTVEGESHEAKQLVIAPLLAAGSSHTCLLNSAGSVACWGADTEGQLVAPSRGTYVQIASNGWHTCVLDADGHPSCWGSNKYGQTDTPDGETFVQLIVGLAHTCGLNKDERVRCWGNPDDGRIDPPVDEIRVLAGGGLHSCGITVWGSVTCWGANDVGQSIAPDGDFVALSLGQRHSCGLTNDGRIDCWGGSTEDGQTKVPGGTYRAMASGGWHSCAIERSGKTVCWGLNDHGQASPPDGVEFERLEAGKHHTCGITQGAEIHCWGRNNFGQGSVPHHLSGSK